MEYMNKCFEINGLKHTEGFVKHFNTVVEAMDYSTLFDATRYIIETKAKRNAYQAMKFYLYVHHKI